ncbi:MAG: gluconokinase [Solirubrobacteraceae bacterium]|nr:gluconokinase [Solirubrobacteraceae bacterium]
MTGPLAAAGLVLGVDVGTTSAKVGAFDPHGAELASAERAYPLREPRPGWVVQDPDEVVTATLAAMAEAVRTVLEGGGRVAAVAFSAAMHSLVGVDAHGRPLTDLLTWADSRALEQAARLRAEHPDLHARTGTPLHPMSPLAKLVWFREHEPALLARAARWAGIKELVLARLTGAWAVDHSVASGTGLMNLQTLGWDGEALALAGVRPDQLSELVPTTARPGGLTEAAATELGLPRGTPVVIGAADGPLANLGVGAVRPGVAACSIGTSGALRVVVERPAVDPARRLFCYALTPGRWVVGGAINNGGVVLQWAGEALAPDLGPHAEAELLDLAARVPPGSDGLLMLPSLLSERAPDWSGLSRGAYVGLTRAHRREHLVRAALEGVCLQLALVLASVREAGAEVREIRATGGFARSGLWRQMLADALGCPIGFPRGHQGSGFGAALLAMEALGLVDSIERSADLVRIDDVVRPDAAAAATYASALPVFAGLHDALGPAFRQLRTPGGPAPG